MTAPALTAQATSGCQPWCTFHNNGTCYSAPDLIPALDGRHFGQLTVEQPCDGPAILSIDLGNLEVDEAGARNFAAQLVAAADRMAEANR
jgi:hypothetical protein